VRHAFILLGVAILATIAWAYVSVPPFVLPPTLREAPEELLGGSESESIDLFRWRVQQENEARRTMIQVCASLAVVGGLWFTWRRIRAAEQTAEASLRVASTAHERRITEVFSQAVDQLAATRGDLPAIESRLGGIFSLARLRDLPGVDLPIAEVLAAYVRENGREAPQNTCVRADIEAAVRVLATPQSRNLDLSGAFLAHGNFRNACFNEAQLTRTNFDQAELQGADLRADLSFASLQSANLRGSNLRQALLSSANLRGADLRGSHLDGADLRNADLSEADLRGARLDFCDMAGAVFVSARFEGATTTEEALPPQSDSSIHGS
jgi:uncharacterized protein YjbI with pentapeptide repeats